MFPLLVKITHHLRNIHIFLLHFYWSCSRHITKTYSNSCWLSLWILNMTWPLLWSLYILLVTSGQMTIQTDHGSTHWLAWTLITPFQLDAFTLIDVCHPTYSDLFFTRCPYNSDTNCVWAQVWGFYELHFLCVRL